MNALAILIGGLQRDGLVKRTVFPTVPPRVDYELTKLGQSLTEPLSILAGWASREKPSIEAAQQEYDAENAA